MEILRSGMRGLGMLAPPHPLQVLQKFYIININLLNPSLLLYLFFHFLSFSKTLLLHTLSFVGREWVGESTTLEQGFYKLRRYPLHGVLGVLLQLKRTIGNTSHLIIKVD